jgi:ABC-2 type transport system permease protein
MNYLRLAAAYFLVGLLAEAAYRINFFFQLLQSILSLVVAVAGLSVVFSYTSALGGWAPNEILVLVGVYIFAGGIISLIIQPGMQDLIESVRDGSLDFVLTMPEDAQLMISLGRINIWGFIDIGLGLAVLITALVRLGETTGAAQAGEFILLLVSGGVIIYSFFLILATLSFWFVRVENILVIFQSMYEAGRWPISLYPGWLRYGLTFVVPVAFATAVPAQALTGRTDWQTLVLAVVIAAALGVLSRLFWKLGLRHYSGTSA